MKKVFYVIVIVILGITAYNYWNNSFKLMSTSEVKNMADGSIFQKLKLFELESGRISPIIQLKQKANLPTIFVYQEGGFTLGFGYGGSGAETGGYGLGFRFDKLARINYKFLGQKSKSDFFSNYPVRFNQLNLSLGRKTFGKKEYDPWEGYITADINTDGNEEFIFWKRSAVYVYNSKEKLFDYKFPYFSAGYFSYEVQAKTKKIVEDQEVILLAIKRSSLIAEKDIPLVEFEKLKNTSDYLILTISDSGIKSAYLDDFKGDLANWSLFDPKIIPDLPKGDWTQIKKVLFDEEENKFVIIESDSEKEWLQITVVAKAGLIISQVKEEGVYLIENNDEIKLDKFNDQYLFTLSLKGRDSDNKTESAVYLVAVNSL